MKKRCGNCNFYISCEDADEEWEVIRYCETDWGYCQAPVPFWPDIVNNNTVSENTKAKHCDTYKKML